MGILDETEAYWRWRCLRGRPIGVVSMPSQAMLMTGKAEEDKMIRLFSGIISVINHVFAHTPCLIKDFTILEFFATR
jgi:hypothetical protein